MESKLEQLLRECEENYKTQPVFLYREEEEIRQISYARFWEDVQKRKAYYRSLPVRRIGLWAYNSYSWIVSAAAMLSAGKTVILLDANLSDEELKGLCDYADVEIVAADDEMAEEIGEIWLGKRKISVISMAQEKDADGNCVMTEDEDAEGEFLCFTSGTSKSAKGVVIPAATLCGCVRHYEELVKGEPGQKFYLPLPYYHIYAFLYIFHILYFGGVQCIGQMGRYLQKDLELMQPEVMFCVPSILRYLLEKDYFPSWLQKVLTGGSYLRPELAAAVEKQGIELYNLYGSSEVLGAIGYSTEEKGTGWICPVKGSRFFQNESGELGVQLPYHMKEYYRKPEDTLEVLDAEHHVFWTGDAGEVDEDGLALIRGRVRDMIVLENGEKIHAEDTDEKLCALSGVKDAAVIAVDGVLTAVLVPEEGRQRADFERELKRMNRNRPSAIRIQNIWIYEEDLPRTTTGKLRRFVLEQKYAKECVRDSARSGEDT